MPARACKLVSSPERRRLNEFGLGESYTLTLPVKRTVPYNEADEEERDASLLGIAIEAAVGMPFAKTLDAHSWDTGYEVDPLADFFEVVARLEKRGLLKQGRPVFMNICDPPRDNSERRNSGGGGK